jgi:hypothetical protein
MKSTLGLMDLYRFVDPVAPIELAGHLLAGPSLE